MTPEEYKKETKIAVDIINAMNSLLGTEYNPNYAQSIFNTDTLVSDLIVFKIFMEDTIEHIKNVGKIYKDQSEYDVFVKKCDNGEISVVKWSDIPDMARKELMRTYNELVCEINKKSDEDHEYLFNKSLQIFKNKYNINKIEM